MHRKQRGQHHRRERYAQRDHEGSCHDEHAADQLEQRRKPRRQARRRDAHRPQHRRKLLRPATELGQAVCCKAEAHHQSEWQERPALLCHSLLKLEH
jgi:hypothetical protein